ncbi:MAG: cobalt transporter CbiM [Burkholderiaceae bacterium]
MHLAEGVLSVPVLATTSALAVGGLVVGLRRLTEAQLPLAALLGAAFFVASTIHVPVGVGSVHLVLNGLAGLLLGWSVFPVFFVALLLQAALFSFGGFTVLGANLLIMAVPALLAHVLLRPLVSAGEEGLPASRGRLIAAGAGCGLIGVGGAALLASAALAASGGSLFMRLVQLFVVAHLPVFVVDSVISALTLSLLARMAPQALAPAPAPAANG